MKKIISFMFIAIAMMCVLSSCSQEDTGIVSDSTFDSFINDLKDFKKKQVNVISSARTRAIEELTDEDRLRMAAQLDSLTEKFILEHAEYLAATMPEWNLSEDELELLSLDEDAFVNFISTYFSPTFCESVSDFININKTRASFSQSQTTTSTTPFEMFVISNLEVVSEMDNCDMQLTDPQQIVSCRDIWKVDLNLCNLRCASNAIQYSANVAAAGCVIGGSIGGIAAWYYSGGALSELGVAAGGTGGAAIGALLGSFAAFVEREACKIEAGKAYYACKEREKNNKPKN